MRKASRCKAVIVMVVYGMRYTSNNRVYKGSRQDPVTSMQHFMCVPSVGLCFGSPLGAAEKHAPCDDPILSQETVAKNG